MPSCTCFAECFSRLLELTRLKLRLRSAPPSTQQRSRSRFHWRNVQKQPMQNIAGKKRAGQEDVDSDCLFANLPLHSCSVPLAQSRCAWAALRQKSQVQIGVEFLQ